jgi:hypothetical protein
MSNSRMMLESDDWLAKTGSKTKGGSTTIVSYKMQGEQSEAMPLSTTPLAL